MFFQGVPTGLATGRTCLVQVLLSCSWLFLCNNYLSLWFHSSNTSLSLLLQGYLKQARKRTDMFTEEKIAKIFSNIEQIYEFHQEILRQLEECFVEDDPCASEIGSVFLNNVSFFCCFIFH